MDKTGTYQFAPESYMLDFRGRVTIPTLCSYMLHAASRHASSRGFGFGDMSGRHTAWVLSRIAIEMAEYPVMPAGPLTLHTWISDVSRLFTCRCFECVGDAGRTVGYAHSTWAAIDVATRRPVPLDGEALRAYLVDDRPCPVMRPGKIPAVEGTAPGEPYRVRYSDLDVNGHFNSIKYMEHLLDMFDIALFRDGEVRRFEIAYLSEGTYDMTLTFHMAGAGDGRYHMAVCHEGRAVCRAAVVWE
ncbi:MAG: acyl-[acyl-carrier-protein] thioesterase [Tannerella sp.]|jgi:acyl-ACP thioesterase|nr:acyl-[acyl-carrier-protein] thioesterase [Tannerella sp.]